MDQEKHPIKWHSDWELHSRLEFAMWEERKRTYQAEVHGMTTGSIHHWEFNRRVQGVWVQMILKRQARQPLYPDVEGAFSERLIHALIWCHAWIWQAIYKCSKRFWFLPFCYVCCQSTWQVCEGEKGKGRKNSKIEIQELIFLKHAHHFPSLSICNY